MKRRLQCFLIMTLVIIGMSSCSDDDVSYEKEVPTVVRFASESAMINVDDEIAFDIPIVISKPNDTVITVKYDVISNTMVENEDFKDLSNGEVVIPAGENEGKILFSSIDGVYDDGGKSFIIKITEVLGGANISATSLSNPSLQVVFNGCPSVAIPNNMFVGNYQIKRVGELGPVGEPTFEEGIVEVNAIGDGVRSFSAVVFPTLGIGQPAMDFTFKLDVCGEIMVYSGQETGLACSDGSLLFGPSETNTGSYEFAPLNDETFTVVFVEFEQPACGESAPFETTYIFTKQ